MRLSEDEITKGICNAKNIESTNEAVFFTSLLLGASLGFLCSSWLIFIFTSLLAVSMHLDKIAMIIRAAVVPFAWAFIAFQVGSMKYVHMVEFGKFIKIPITNIIGIEPWQLGLTFYIFSLLFHIALIANYEDFKAGLLAQMNRTSKGSSNHH